MMIYSLARGALAWYHPRPMHYLLMYDVVDDYVERRTPFRLEHISLARAAVARGDLVLGGALAQPADGVVLLFRGSSPAAAEALKVVLEGSLADLATGLRLETAAFLRLAGTENSRHLVAEFLSKTKK